MSQPTTSRKRSASAMSMSDGNEYRYQSQLPSDSINPLSHTPSILRQLNLAGLAETDELPSTTQHRFPHRHWQDPDAPPARLGRSAASKALETSEVEEEEEERNDDDDDNLEDEEGKRRRRKKKDGGGIPKAKYASEKSPFRPLVRAIYNFLDTGDISNAKRAFGILARSTVHGKPVDVRRNNYWALGAEILMREGGSARATAADDEAYPFANAPVVREYFRDLIQRFPYNFKHRRAVCAVDFWPALLSYEVFQVHAQHAASLRRMNREAEDWEDESWQEPSSLLGGGGNDSMMDGTGYHARPGQVYGRDMRLRQARDQIRLKTLDLLREVAGRMNDLLEDRPFSHSAELWRVRGMVSLYIGDLLIPAYTHDDDDEGAQQMAEARVRREAERNNARSSFQKMVEHGGKLDALIQRLMAPVEEDEGPVLPVFSSLAFREYRTAS
ncbi:hypothetical protein BDP55DRAFT_202142 [Colletotrichum godetiae]|uniref:Uncharacterized protein n=1 Tax=Colletotrichum godetiae TaxID=1209918 RepID=A0AAJ0EY33_9PEZI|nr:uncharacterized protein BDP55DRAFT_202142 [Colletotrichum godetiae]KAK1699657.1 hypothetical protein BDP55DRAFT_202142 [Colletotrichum godetiae]